ncbi:MAG TPA: response regulator [Sediminispirochaeta sp.]|nr:response regulator [Sediminispirochaeta sp.]
MNGKILLVEDEALIVMSEVRTLERHGFEVRVVRHGEQAVEIVGSEEGVDLNLVLMDIDLGPGMDGTEAAVQILKKRDLPIVFLSSHTEPEVVEKTEGITSYGYIVKNSGDTVLIASIKMAFRLFEAKKRNKEDQ